LRLQADAHVTLGTLAASMLSDAKDRPTGRVNTRCCDQFCPTHEPAVTAVAEDRDALSAAHESARHLVDQLVHEGILAAVHQVVVDLEREIGPDVDTVCLYA